MELSVGQWFQAIAQSVEPLTDTKLHEKHTDIGRLSSSESSGIRTCTFVPDSTEIGQTAEYPAGMVLAQRLNAVRKRYKKRVHNRGENQRMLTKYMKQLTNQNCPVVLSITETVPEPSEKIVIQRNDIHEKTRSDAGEIYLRAREIYFRARRQRPVRAASIF